MTPKQAIKHAKNFPFDADNKFWNSDGKNPPIPRHKYHLAALAVIADLQDRGGIKQELDNIDEDIRKEIVNSLTAIIEEATKQDT